MRAFALILSICFWPSILLAQPKEIKPSRVERAETFLSQLGLPELQILHLERELAVPQLDGKTTAYANRLADLYASWLLGLADVKKAEEFNQRIDNLVSKFPQANTPSLQVIRLQGDYNRSENLAAKWVADPDDVKSRNEALTILARISPRFDVLQERMHQLVKLADEQLDPIPEGKLRDFRTQERNKLAQIAGKALYFAGWSNYYLGLMSSSGNTINSSEMQRSRLVFRKFLRIEKLDPAAKAEEMNLAGEVPARVILGLGLAEIGGGDRTAADIAFRLLRDPATAAEVRDRVGFWQVWALLNAGINDQAKEIARKEIAEFKDASTPGKAGLAILLVRAGFAKKNRLQPDLGLLGIQGLVRLKRYELARHLLSKYQVDTSRFNDFAFQMITGQNFFEQAEKSKEEKDYLKAAESLQTALASPDAGRERILSAQCHFLLGWCNYRTGKFEKAHEEFQKAQTDFQAMNSETAGDAAWMSISASQKLLAGNPQLKEITAKALDSFKKNFPGHANAPKVDFLLLRMNRNINLDTLAPNDPNYPEVCFMLCQKSYGEWKNSKKDPAKAKEFQQAMEKFLVLPNLEKTPDRKLECLHNQIDIALASRPPNFKLAEEALDQANQILVKHKMEDRFHTDYHFLRFQSGLAQGQDKKIREEMQWIRKNRKGSAHEEAGLLQWGKWVEGELKSSPAGKSKELRSQAIEVYSQLAEIFGNTPEQIKGNKNALIAHSRLAGHAMDQEEYDLAGREMDQILKAYPLDINYLRKAGLSHFKGKQYPRALECWKILEKGLPKETDPWWEAKYYVIAAQTHINPGEAKKSFADFKASFPHLGPAPWKDEYPKLEKVFTP